METCRREHALCSWTDDHPLPSRVIDVGSNLRQDDPFLLIANGQRGSWATLSHCWGGELPIRTTVGTLEARRKAISTDELPPTFRDAIKVTRKLGLRYLWIDSLCIIQDCREDWTRESIKMHEIYSKAAVNISASSTRDAKEGIFSCSDEKRQKPALITLPCYSLSQRLTGLVSIRVRPKYYLYDQPLHSWAWVLQESILSPRRLDYASEQIHWTCRTSTFSEGLPHLDDEIDHLVTGGRNLFRIPVKKYDAYPDMEFPGLQTPMGWWYATLSWYQRRNISVHNDLLPAIAGAAKIIGQCSGYHYKAGLWLEDIHRGLLWISFDSTTRPHGTSASTWSWASTNFPWHGTPRLYLQTYRPGYRAKILQVDVETSGNSPFSEVLSASLKLQSHCLPFTSISNNPTFNRGFEMSILNRFRGAEYLRQDTQVVSPGRMLCTLDERPPHSVTSEACCADLVRRGVICIQIARFGHETEKWPLEAFQGYTEEFGREKLATVFSLMLEPTGRAEDEYKRIGIAEIHEDDIKAGEWDERVVTIV